MLVISVFVDPKCEGIAQMNGNDIDAACRSFTTAAVKFGQSHLGAAKNYNLLGRAAC